MRTLGVILAGGLSRRMGRDKGLIPIAGRPLASWVAARAKPQVDMLMLNANGDLGRFAFLGLPVVSDSGPAGEGPLAGLCAGLRASRGFTHLATFASDSPLFPLDLVECLHEALSVDADYAIAASDGREHPVFSLWPIQRAQDVLDLFASGARALYELERVLRKRVVAFPLVDGDPFFNANTPDDLHELERRLAACPQADP